MTALKNVLIITDAALRYLALIRLGNFWNYTARFKKP
jgi:isoprenylcysteine carboxyl methyltransferase (ICMT) family protein YpbQ